MSTTHLLKTTVNYKSCVVYGYTFITDAFFTHYSLSN